MATTFQTLYGLDDFILTPEHPFGIRRSELADATSNSETTTEHTSIPDPIDTNQSEPVELIPYDTSRDITSLITEFHDHHDRLEGDAYVFDAEMLSNTRLQNFLMTIDHRARPEQRKITMPDMSRIIEHGLSMIVDGYDQLEHRDCSKVFHFNNGDVLLRVSGFINRATETIEIIRYTKKFKVDRMIDDVQARRVFDYSLYASAFLLASRYPAIGTMIKTIHEHFGEFHITEHFPYISSNNTIESILEAYISDINSGELPPECEDKWTTRAGVNSRCEKYCSVKDICPFYTSTHAGS